MFLFHAQNIVNTQFFLAALHHEAVCIKEKNTCAQPHNHKPHGEHNVHCPRAAHRRDPLASLYGAHDIKHHRRHHPSQNAGQIKLPVIF